MLQGIDCCKTLEIHASTVLEADYNDAELVGYTQPPLTNVLPWIKYKAQNMMEPIWRAELTYIKEDNHI